MKVYFVFCGLYGVHIGVFDNKEDIKKACKKYCEIRNMDYKKQNFEKVEFILNEISEDAKTARKF